MANSWQAIQEEFMRRIGEREWPPGELIPSEVDLAEELGCSRVTVNRALRQLAERGFIDRKRKAGSRVLLNPERKATFAIPVIRSEVEAAGSVYSHQLISEKQSTAPSKIAQKMQLSADSELLHLKTLHYADEQVFAFEDRWLHREAVPEIASVDFGQISCNEWLVANTPFSHGELDIGAHKSSAAEAKLLACEVGEACLETFRLTWAGTQVITYVRLLHAPSRRLKTTL